MSDRPRSTVEAVALAIAGPPAEPVAREGERWRFPRFYEAIAQAALQAALDEGGMVLASEAAERIATELADLREELDLVTESRDLIAEAVDEGLREAARAVLARWDAKPFRLDEDDSAQVERLRQEAER